MPVPSPSSISAVAFSEALARYPAVLQAVSEIKGAKPGQQTLAELDHVRYVVAPARFGLAGGATVREAMALDDVKTLVQWKLKHGKFRPTLMKLVASNDPAAVTATAQDALAAYEAALQSDKTKDDHAAASEAAVAVFSRLRGIGPATASLLAAVQQPRHCIFFGDEVYAWLCGGSGLTRPAKYNDKEYATVARAAADVMARLAAGAQDVEQVAYVLVNGGEATDAAVKEAKKAKKGKVTAETPADVKAAKRKQPPTDATAGARRSSRLRST